MITTKCNRACPHCMFFCSPKNKKAVNLNIDKALKFIKTIPRMVDINEICIYGGEPTLYYKLLKYFISRLPRARRIQILTNGYFKDKKQLNKFELFCKWFNKKNNFVKISNDKYHDIFQDRKQLNELIKIYPNLVWKRREDPKEFIKMGRWQKHPIIFTKPVNCILRIESINIEQDGKIDFCCGGYSSAIGTIKEDFQDIIKKRHKFLKFLREKEGKITHDTCKRCRQYFSEYFKTSFDTRWGK